MFSWNNVTVRESEVTSSRLSKSHEQKRQGFGYRHHGKLGNPHSGKSLRSVSNHFYNYQSLQLTIIFTLQMSQWCWHHQAAKKGMYYYTPCSRKLQASAHVNPLKMEVAWRLARWQVITCLHHICVILLYTVNIQARARTLYSSWKMLFVNSISSSLLSLVVSLVALCTAGQRWNWIIQHTLIKYLM